MTRRSSRATASSSGSARPCRTARGSASTSGPRRRTRASVAAAATRSNCPTVRPRRSSGSRLRSRSRRATGWCCAGPPAPIGSSAPWSSTSRRRAGSPAGARPPNGSGASPRRSRPLTPTAFADARLDLHGVLEPTGGVAAPVRIAPDIVESVDETIRIAVADAAGRHRAIDRRPGHGRAGASTPGDHRAERIGGCRLGPRRPARGRWPPDPCRCRRHDAGSRASRRNPIRS